MPKPKSPSLPVTFTLPERQVLIEILDHLISKGERPGMPPSNLGYHAPLQVYNLEFLHAIRRKL